MSTTSGTTGATQGSGSTQQDGATNTQAPNAGGGRQNRRNGLRGGNGRNANRGNRNSRSGNNNDTHFTGATSGLEGCTFGIHDGYTGAKKYSDNIKQLKIYAFRNFTTDLGTLFGKSPAMPSVEKPTITDEQKKDTAEVELHKLELKEYMEVKRKMAQEVKKMYAVIFGQCTEAMLNKVKASEDYEEMNDEGNAVWLLTKIRKITYLSDEKEDPFVSTVGSASRLYKLVQERESLINYYET